MELGRAIVGLLLPEVTSNDVTIGVDHGPGDVQDPDPRSGISLVGARSDDLAKALDLGAFGFQEFDRDADPRPLMSEADRLPLDFEILERSVEDADSDRMG